MVYSSIIMTAYNEPGGKRLCQRLVDNIAPKKILLAINLSYYCTLPHLTYLYLQRNPPTQTIPTFAYLSGIYWSHRKHPYKIFNIWPSLKFCQFAVLRPTRQNRRDPIFFSLFPIFFFLGGFRALRSYAENRHQRRPRTSKIISLRPDSKGMPYIPISFRMINSCQNKCIKCIS